MICDLNGKDVLVWLCREANSIPLDDIEAYRRGEREQPGRTYLEEIAEPVFRAVDEYACGLVLLVYGEDDRYATILREECKRSSACSRASCVTVSEERLASLLETAGNTAIYTVPDNADLPPALDEIDKYWFDYEKMRPWPAGVPKYDLKKLNMAAAWTRYFLPGTYDLACQLEKVRTIVKNKGRPGITQYVLITGESGTGKSFFTRNLPRICDDAYNDPKKPFAPPSADELIDESYGYLQGNCASLSPELADSLLFGAVAGAYTGCNKNVKGLIESARDGILFLDEVGDLPLATQGKLLTALEEKTYYRLGDTEGTRNVRHVRCCIVFGTNRNLVADARKWEDSNGRTGFRKDLLYRINSCHLELPPLRERLSDKYPETRPAFLDGIVERYCDEIGLALTDGARAAFDAFACSYPWPGNFRDVKHLFEELKVKTLEDGVGTVISAYMMKKALGRLNAAKAEDDTATREADERELPLIDRMKARFPSPCEANEIDFIFRVCRDARSCAEAGRNYFGTEKQRNFADAFGKRLAHFKLVFDKSAPGHLCLRPATDQAE